MKLLSAYKTNLKLNTQDEVFHYLISNLKKSSILWTYFVNWDKVFKNSKSIEVSLNTLNYLIGKSDFDEEFRFLIKKDPGLAKVLPALAVRDGKNNTEFDILIDYTNKKLVYEHFDFSESNPSDADISNYLRFLNETGIKKLFTDKKVKNLVDYVIGVEAGLDSNARKNRGGKAMETISEAFIKQICNDNGFEYIPQANRTKIKKQFGIEVPVDKSSRKYDFAIKTRRSLYLVEVNYYGGGGSKLKSTAGEYRNLFDTLNNKFEFIWITDGNGWVDTSLPLRETFDHNDYVLNLSMVEEGILEAILRNP